MPKLFSAKTIPFLKTAGEQTDPEWLEQNKTAYEDTVRLPFIELAENLKAELSPLAPGYHFPSKGIGRIKRASNKVISGQACYKNRLSLSAAVPNASRFEHNPLLFFGILPFEQPWEGIIVAGGLFMPSSPQLKKLRSAVALDSKPFHELFKDRSFKARFKSPFSTHSCAAKVPRDFEPDHPDADWLKLKSFLVVKKLSLAEFTSADLANSVAKDFKQLLRLNQLIDEMLDA